MIQDQIQKYLNEVDGILKGHRLEYNDDSFVFPEVETMAKDGQLLINLIRTTYYTICEAYAKNMLKEPLYEYKEEMESFLSESLNVYENRDNEIKEMIKFLVMLNNGKKDHLFIKYDGFIEGTHWTFGDLSGAITYRVQKAFDKHNENN